MAKHLTPLPPHCGPGTHCLVQEGLVVSHIWILTDKGAATIESQYATAKDIMRVLKVSRATAYRIISKQSKRYWCADWRDKQRPRCCAVIPRHLLSSIDVQPIGNPGFRSGIYQQSLARRLRSKKR